MCDAVHAYKLIIIDRFLANIDRVRRSNPASAVNRCITMNSDRDQTTLHGDRLVTNGNRVEITRWSIQHVNGITTNSGY